MGGAIIAGISKTFRVVLCEQDRKKASQLKRKYSMAVADLESGIKECSVIILAVKPQGFEGLLAELKNMNLSNKLWISIAAGVTCRYIEKALNNKPRVIRTMPNLPAQIQQGVTGISMGRFASNKDLKLACRIFDLIGTTVVVAEKDLDSITAISGSGPAYVFHFVEAFEKAASNLGIKDNAAHKLIVQTLKGSLALLEHQQESADILRKRVTSKGGTTEAALKVFQKHKYEKIFKDALSAAKKRAKELSRS